MTEPPADERQRSLPGEHPKSQVDDPDAAKALARILASDSYREADEDVGFLQGKEARGPRLQLEYLKAETLLQEHDIRHTIVVFGGTRVLEPRAARRRLDECTAAAAAAPGDPQAQHLNMFVPVAGRIEGAERTVRPAFSFDGKHATTVRAAPVVDQHSEEIRAALKGNPGAWPELNRETEPVAAAQ